MTLPVLGVDLGGANLKYVSLEGRAHCTAFPMWTDYQRLASQLQLDLQEHYPGRHQVAATMTGELADCFVDRQQGVDHIAQALVSACKALHWPAPAFYHVDGTFHDEAETRAHCDRAAASNWHGLANFVAKVSRWDAVECLSDLMQQLTAAPTSAHSTALLIDIGSTTSDLIPLKNGDIASSSATDFDRLKERSLVYLGCQRTAVCSLIEQLPFAGTMVPVMRELFATMDDVRLLTGHQAENNHDFDSADGKARGRLEAANRMARMIGLDHRNVSMQDAESMAHHIHQQAQSVLTAAIDTLIANEQTTENAIWLISGHGMDLLSEARSKHSGTRMVSLQDILGPEVSRSAPAFAIAALYQHSL
ncbi:hypothetical protein SV7mr_06590 [Stieleria bergensis]|uniref:Hydantoinase A/oxoprolinase domain-containing protein n=1 Tax=Stieleria bergensis TaxID=2528025 RepID=A0A517SPX5_9BACT|nr:hypothetical protein SV7mr_06590 [Planctomycetes bacterium SV_7m_r]